MSIDRSDAYMDGDATRHGDDAPWKTALDVNMLSVARTWLMRHARDEVGTSTTPSKDGTLAALEHAGLEIADGMFTAAASERRGR